MPSTLEARHRLTELMEDRRRELRLRWQDVAEAGNVSLRALQAARLGDAEIRPLTQRGIEDGLRWPAGYIQAVLDGKEPNLGGYTAHPPASASRPEPPADEPPEPVPPAVATAISALGKSIEPIITQQITHARMRDPGATGAEIFADGYEAAVWDLRKWPEFLRIATIAFLRASRVQAEAGAGEPDSSRRAPHR